VITLLQLCAQIVAAIGKVDGSSGVQSEHALHFLRLLAVSVDEEKESREHTLTSLL
jgi:hypothetical protein